MAILHIDDVSLIFPHARGGRGVVAIDRVSMTVPDQAFAVIVGPSGCGKTTLLRMAAGLERPTGGTLRLGDQCITGPGADRGMVFQSYTLFPWLTVRGNIEFGLRLAGVSTGERRDRCDYFLAEVGLGKFADAYPKQLSGGMMQRVAIARALVTDPKILLMDEPFGALDSQTRGLMQELLTKIWFDTHKQILFVTHDIDEAIFLGQRIHVMTARPGRIKEVVEVGFPYPRSLDTLTSPEFIAVRQRIHASIREEVLKAQQDDE